MVARGWLEADWPAPPGVRAGISLRDGDGVSAPPYDRLNLGMNSGDEPQAVRENRARLAAMLGLPSEPVWLRQVHGVGVFVMDAEVAGKAADAAETADRGADAAGRPAPAAELPEADAAVTRRRGTVLAILTADCLPVVFAAADGGELAAAHAGWRGLAAGVLEATVAAMATPPARLRVWLGPAAGPARYEVGREVYEAFTGPDPGAATAFAPTRPGHWRMDLFSLARRRLAALGVRNVHGGGLCTISDPARFYSHRRDQRTGRMATVAWILP
ncbi:peptidoglycan editing factor PgeF [Arenimonas fontis]|uniref:peptidoglycan editing factor PgeF n=1 Tax=Arenimonas fontis TaxID=2608255 RepID=UPI003CCC8EB0